MNPLVRILRIVLPLLFVGFLALIAVNYTSAHRRDDSPAEDTPVSPLRPVEKPTVIARGFEDTQSLGGRVYSRIRAGQLLAFQSGWYTLEETSLEVFQEDGTRYSITSEHAQFNPETKAAEVKGGVIVRSSHGVEVRTDALLFDGREVTNKVPVQFSVENWRGNAGGVRVGVREQTLQLVRGVRAVWTSPTPGEPPVVLTASGATFLRGENELRFDGDVRIERPNETVRADAMRVRTAEDGKTITALEGQGNVLVEIQPGSRPGGSPGSGLPATTRATAERFFGEMSEGGDLNAIHLHGSNMPVHVVLFDQPRRELSSSALRIGFHQKAVSEIRAEGNARLQELGPAPRVVTAGTMIVTVDPVSGKASTAYLDRDVRFRDPKSEARSDKATYDIVGDRMILVSAANAAPTITSEGTTLKATTIEVAPKEGVLKGNGNVVARLVSDRSGSGVAPRDNVVFGGDQPVYVNSESVVLRNASKFAAFSGNVRAWQEKNTVLADELQIQNGGETIQARGNVRTIAPGRTEAQGAINTRSDSLVAKRADRRIELDGSVQIDEQQRRLNSDRAIFFFDKEQKLERVESIGRMVMVDRATQRKGSGERGIYRVQQKTLLVEGSPAVMTDPSGEIRGSQVVVDLEKNKVEVISSDKPTEATFKPGTRN